MAEIGYNLAEFLIYYLNNLSDLLQISILGISVMNIALMFLSLSFIVYIIRLFRGFSKNYTDEEIVVEKVVDLYELPSDYFWSQKDEEEQ